MKALNHREISRSFQRFLAWFAGLFLTIIACVYSCVKTSSYQSDQLVLQKDALDQVFYTDDMLADKADSLYTYLSLLDSSRIDSAQMQRLVTRKKEEFDKLIRQQPKTDRYFVVYNRLISHVDEMLMLKDSLYKVRTQESDLRDELRDCLRQAVLENRQRKRGGSTN